MRCNRVIAIGAIFATLVGCSAGPKDKAAPRLPVNPTPTKPGEVVVLAGDGKDSQRPQDGAYGVQTSISPVGGISAAPDGSVYFGVKYADSTRVARLGADGRLKLLDPRLQVYEDPEFRTHSTKLTASNTDLWLFSSENSGSLQQFSLDEKSPPKYLFGRTTDTRVRFIDIKGRKLSDEQQQKLSRNWKASAFGIRWDGAPIVATEAGELYEALGDNKVRRWNPTGYSMVLDSIRSWFGRQEPLYTNLILEDSSNLYVVGNGTIRIPRQGKAEQIGKANPGAAPGWSGGVVLDRRSLLLTRLVGYDGTLLRFSDTGAESQIRPGTGQECSDGGRPRGLREGGLYGLARRPDGTYVTTACNRVFGFRLPGGK